VCVKRRGAARECSPAFQGRVEVEPNISASRRRRPSGTFTRRRRDANLSPFGPGLETPGYIQTPLSGGISHGLQVSTTEGFSVAIESFSSAIEKLSTATERLSVAMAKPSSAIEKLSVAMEKLSTTIEKLSVAVEKLSITMEKLSIAMEKSSRAL